MAEFPTINECRAAISEELAIQGLALGGAALTGYAKALERAYRVDGRVPSLDTQIATARAWVRAMVEQGEACSRF